MILRKKPEIINILRKWERDGYVCACTPPKDFDHKFGGYTAVREVNGDVWTWMQMGDCYWFIYRGEPKK